MASGVDYPKRPLLSREEERKLFVKIKAGDGAARDYLIECNITLVKSLAVRYGGHSLSQEDLIQEGILGLIKAVKQFDPLRGHRFSTYATPSIRQAIRRALQVKDHLIRLPTHAHELGARIRKSSRLTGSEECEPDRAELAAETGFSPELIDDILRAIDVIRTMTSINIKIDDDNVSRYELIADPSVDVVEEVLRSSQRQLLLALLARILTEREYMVIVRRYGLYTGIPMTHKEVSESLKKEGIVISITRTGQIVEAAIRKLRQRLSSQALG